MRTISIPKLSTFLVLFLSSIYGNAQKINGIVYDENNKPLANVEILNQKNSFVTISNPDGSFTIKGHKNDLLKFEYPSKPRISATAIKIKGLKVNFADGDVIAKKELKRRERKYNKTNPKPIYVKDHDLRGNPLRKPVIGQVNDRTGPIPGVNVRVKGTTIATQTDFDGYYGINAKIGDVLEFSFVGMYNKQVNVNNKIMNVMMGDYSVHLDEVVVTSLGYSKKDKATTSYSVAAESKEESFRKALEGKVAGVSVATRTEKDDSTIVIRGAATGSSEKIRSERAGQLTAGEVNDFSRYAYWEGLGENELKEWKKQWKFNPAFRYSVSLKNDKGFPIVNKKVHLVNDSGILWTAKTDNTGRAELWLNPSDLISVKASNGLEIIDEEDEVLVASPKEFHEGINFYTYKQNCKEQNKINIAFVIDATGSMGDEIKYLQAELNDVIDRTKKEFPSADLTMGSVFYRDAGDDYLVKNFDFTSSIPNVISFIQRQYADGGGDYPEAVIEALEASIENMSWDDDARTRLLFLLLDAPPHYTDANVAKLQILAKKAAEKGIRIIPIAASGIDKSTEYLMRAIALETNGTYLFITNHSGIGNNHIEPSTESYKVEMLNELILRVIIQNCSVNNCNSQVKDYSTNTKIEEALTPASDVVNFRYFPNPTPDFVTVTIDKEATELYLYDTTGKLIIYKAEKSKEYKIDLSSLPNAVYYLKVMVADKPFFGKIIKRN